MIFIKKIISIKSYLIATLLIFSLFNSANANSLDELIKDRQSLLNEYDSIISTAKAHPDTDRRVFDLQNRIIAIDNFIIVDQFIKQIEDNKKLEKDYDDLMLYLYIAAGATAFFLLLFIIFVGLYAGVKRRSKKSFGQIADLQTLLESYQKDIAQLSEECESYKKKNRDASDKIYKLEERVSDFDKRGAANHMEMIRIKSENSKLKEQLESSGGSKLEGGSYSRFDDEKIAELNQTIELKESQIRELNDKIEVLMGELNFSEVEFNKKIETEVALTNELESLKKELMAVKLSGSSDEPVRNNEKNNEIDDLIREIEKLRKDNNCLADMVKAAEELQKDLAQEIADLEDDVCPDESNLSLEMKELKNNFEKQTTEFMKAQQRYEDMHESKKALEWKNKVLEDEINNLKTFVEKQIPIEAPVKQEAPQKPNNYQIEDLLQQNLDLQDELNDFKKLLDEELENRQILIKEFKELEAFYKDQIHIEERVKPEEHLDSSSEIKSQEIEKLISENEELKKQIASFDIMFKDEEQARVNLENELIKLLEQFKNSSDTNIR
jgi:hypothetical protein